MKGASTVLRGADRSNVVGLLDDIDFIFHTLIPELKKIHNTTSATTVKHLSVKDIRNIEKPFPPKSEQKKISTILTSVDTVIEKTEAEIEKLQLLKKGMMQELLTKGIGHTKLKNSSVGLIPSKWEITQLHEVATIQTGVAKNSKITGDLIDMPYLRVANVQDGYLDLTEIKSIKIPRGNLSRYLLNVDDVLVNEGGDFDKLGRGYLWNGQISPCIHQNHVFVVRTDKSKLLPKFFDFLSGSEIGKKYYLGCAKQTTNLASINSTQLKQFPVLLPPLSEQIEIIKYLNSAEDKLSLLKQALIKKKQLKKGLMQDLLFGKVRVKVD